MRRQAEGGRREDQSEVGSRRSEAERLLSAVPFDDLPLSGRRSFTLPVGEMADGSEVGVPVLVATGRAHRPRLVCVAGIHGNEHEGVTALLELWAGLDPSELNGTLVLVTVANPPAYRAGERRNPDDHLDMNRIFPGRADGTITERLAHRLFHDVVLGADFVLSLHGWGRAAMVTPYTEYPRDSPVTTASRAAAAAFGLEWLEPFDWPPGMMVAVCARQGIPAIEPEIGGIEITLPEQRSRYTSGIHNLLRHLGMEPGQPDVPPSVRDVHRVELGAPAGGVIRRSVELGDNVVAGDQIAVITDLLGNQTGEVVSPRDGFVAALRLSSAVNPGQQVAVVFQPREG